jgi:serine/threonine protein kinase
MNESEPNPQKPIANGPAKERTAPSPPRPAARIPDHELLRLIGRGAYGEVWLARSITGEYRAVKVVFRSSFEQERPYEREFEGIRKFEPISRSHESQVDILHVGRDQAQGCFFYVMELADEVNASVAADANSQASLSRVLSDPATYQPRTLKSELLKRGRLPAAECVKLGLALTTALEHLHSHGLVHRDVKPSNIIFINGQPKLADIGLVTNLDATRSHVGTLGFAPPEGPGSVTGDLYSLGKVLYEAATGRDRQEFPELPTRLGETREDEAGLIELNEVILKACDNEPKRRYQSAEAMRTDLAVLDRGQSLATQRSAQRRLAILLKVGAVSVALAFGVRLLTRPHFPAQEPALSIPVSSHPRPAKPAEQIPDARDSFPSERDALEPVAGQVTRLTPGNVGGRPGFAKVRLNIHPVRWGVLYADAVRFTTPPEKGLDLAWAFTKPKASGRLNAWWLMPVGDWKMEGGFREMFLESHPDAKYENVPDAAGKRLILQGLPGKWLDPNRDYMICFEFQNAQPAEFQIALNFVSTQGACESNQVALENALGLILKKDSQVRSNIASPAKQ